MSSSRRYSEEEIEAIFRVAAEAQEAARQARPHGEGLTMDELQEIGAEAGITPEFIAHAAESIRASHPAPSAPVSGRGHYLGMPYKVHRTIDLPSTLGEKEWERIVVACRQTFQVSGKVESEGSIRQWRHGNLFVTLEPTPDGQQLRMGSRRDATQSAMLGTLIAVSFALFFLVMLAASGKIEQWKSIALILSIASVGLGFGGWAAFTTPRWAREREDQMDAIGEYALQIAQAGIHSARAGTHAAQADSHADTLAESTAATSAASTAGATETIDAGADSGIDLEDPEMESSEHARGARRTRA